jgi:hypothetical protein
MKALIKDLRYNIGLIQDAAGNPDYYHMQWRANVVIKREGEFYEVPIAMSYDIKYGDKEFVLLMNNAFDRFEEHCEQVSSKWKLVENTENLHGRPLGQTKITL